MTDLETVILMTRFVLYIIYHIIAVFLICLGILSVIAGLTELISKWKGKV